MSQLLTYAEAAKKLGVHKGTLCRQIAQVNKRKKGSIKPDHVKVISTNLSKHYFLASSLPRIKDLISKAVKPVGRPATVSK